MPRITIRDIALKAGVSQTAVSFVLNGKKGVSDDTREKVLAIMRELNYTPSAKAGEECVVMIMNPHQKNRLSAFLPELMASLTENNLELKIFSAGQLLRDMRRKLTGCIAVLMYQEVDRRLLEDMQELVPRILVMDGEGYSEHLVNISVDYAEAAYAMAGYLAMLGHRNFLYINEELPPTKNLICFSGFQRQLVKMHFPMEYSHAVMNLSMELENLDDLLKIVREKNISSVICTSEKTAIRIINHCFAQGIRIPEELSVAAICDDEITGYPGFSLTHISLNRKNAHQKLVDLITMPADKKTEDYMVPVSRIHPGKSTRQPKFNPEKKKMALVIPLREHPTYRIVRAGFINQVKQMGYQALVSSTTDEDPESYRQACLALGKERPDGIVMWMPLKDVSEQLSAQGTMVACMHNIMKNGEKHGVSVNITVDPFSIAQAVTGFFAEKIGDVSGEIIVAVGQEEQDIEMIENFVELMRNSCPNIKVNSLEGFTEDNEKNRKLAMNLLNAYPNALGVYTTTGLTCVSWAFAKRMTGRKSLMIVGTDYSDETIHLIDTGEVDAFVAQPIYEESQLSVVSMDALMRGYDVEYSSTLEAPLVTKDNVEKYRKLLREIENWYT